MANTPGSANVAAQIAADLEGQTVALNNISLSMTGTGTLTVDADATTQTEGIILTSNNGTKYKLSVSDIGALTAEAV